VRGRTLRRHQSVRQQLRDQRVVLGQSLQHAVAHAVGARVAGVHDAQPAVRQEHAGGQRRGHPVQSRVRGRRIEDGR
jgi:hypothetical protein